MNKYKSIIALILSIALCISCFTASLSTVSAEYVITQLKTEDFENSDYTNALWETVNVNTAGASSDNSNATVVTPYSVIDDNGNKVMITNRASVNKSPVVMMYKQGVWPAESLDSVTMKVKFPSSSNSSYDGAVSIMPFYLEKKGDHTEGTVIYIQLQNTDGKLSVRCGNNSKYAVRENANTLTSGVVSTNDWITVKMEYDYSEMAIPKLGIKYTFTGEDGTTATYTVKYQLTLAESGYEGNYFRFGIGSYANANYITYFDDISCEFTKTAVDEVNAFYTEYSEIFELDSWNDSYLAKVNAAADDFTALSDEAAEILKSRGLISSLKALLEGTSALAEQKAYLDKYANLLSKGKPTLASDEQDTLDALAEYETLSNLSKMFLVEEYVKLTGFKDEFKFFRADDDYSPFNFNFEDGLSPFENVLEGDVYAKNIVVDDPTQSETANKVLNLKGKQSAFMLKYWPTRGEIQKVSFRAYSPKNESFTPWRAMFSYIDEGNWYAMRPVNLAGGGLRISTEASADFLRKSGYLNTELTMDGWVEYEITFTASSMIVSVKDPNKQTAQTTGSFSYGGKFGFAFFHSHDHIGYDVYIDDLSVQLKNGAGDFDMNEEPTDINIYFSGNTFLNPDETMILTGENLFETTDKLYMSTLDTDLSGVKDANTMPQVVGQEAYDRDASTEGNYADTALHKFDDANDYEAQVVQRSFNAINAIIPKELTKGIYSLKATSKKGVSDKVIYVNRPEISFATGDEGDIATHGGYVQIVGNNLYPTGNINDVTVKLVSANKDIYLATVKDVSKNNNQSVEIAIDDSIPYGDYQVYLHNGYGDNTAWSMPSVITVGASPKDSWPKTVFNVMNYGAGGQGLTNDTPAVIRALEDAAINGGGIVYFPRGVYSVVTTLAIPEYVTILGDGENISVIRFEARRWQYSELPSGLISIIGNTEIKNIAIQGTRFASIIKQYRPSAARFPETEETDNVYFTNTSVRFTPSAGTPSSGGNGGWSTDEYTATEITAIIAKEISTGVKLDMRGNSNNFQWNNFKFSFDSMAGSEMTEPSFRIWARQIQIRGAAWMNYSLVSTSYGCIIEDCDLTAAGFNPSGNGFYMHNNYFHDSWGNNRELLTTDGKGYTNNSVIQFIGDNPDLMEKYLGTRELDYTAFISATNKYAIPMIENYNLIVKDGQGRGQARIIKEVKNVEVLNEENKKTTVSVIFVDKPFTVAPNRRSRVDIYEPRLDFSFINNRFREGAACGTYGTMINSVWDGNEFSRHSGQKFNIHEGSVWYTTFKNQRHYEAIYMHGEGFGASGSAAMINNKANLNASLYTNTSNAAAAAMGMSLRNCTFEEYGYQIASGGVADALSGFVMENCTFTDRKAAIRLTENSTGMFTAVLFRNNTFDTDEIFDSEYNYQQHISETNINRQGYQRIIILNSNYDEAYILIGDVNLDGKVSLKDATVLRFYLGHKVELNEQQLLRADANEDSRVSLKDVTAIREMILGIYEEPDGGSSGGSSGDSSGGSSGGSSGDSSDDSSGGSSGGSSGESSGSSPGSSGPSIDNSGWIDGDF